MKREIRASISAIAAAVMLAACASKGPTSSTGLTSADDQTSAEYQRLIDNAGKQQLICQREQVLGSRIATQVCLTPAQLEEQRRQSDDLVRDIRRRDEIYHRQQNPDRPPMPPPMPRAPQ